MFAEIIAAAAGYEQSNRTHLMLADELGRLRYEPAVLAPIEVWERCLGHMAMAKAGHALSAVYVAAMGGSHPLAKRVGATAGRIFMYASGCSYDLGFPRQAQDLARMRWAFRPVRSRPLLARVWRRLSGGWRRLGHQEQDGGWEGQS